jgi:hypothetical protein
MKNLLVILALGVAVTSCTVVNRAPTPKPPQTQLQTREYQTREFDTNDVKLVMKAMLNVLQDDGFVVKNAVPDLGLLTATKEIQLTGSNNQSDQFWSDVFASLVTGSNNNRNNRDTPTRYNKFKIVEVSVNVSEIGRRTKVRANFQAKVLDNEGNPVDVYTIQDQKFYQDFFAKVDKGIFLQKSGF